MNEMTVEEFCHMAEKDHYERLLADVKNRIASDMPYDQYLAVSNDELEGMAKEVIKKVREKLYEPTD